ncbi:alanine--tRNA ligase [Aurantimicrobium sp. MWH-Uga1]|uniref:alanine--tRNA ligase n=1 Tax=Aurantimicrobium sp. MWH-Uga1 TaxID=2079575 RepID=UPI000DEDB4A6|nr:alanine--tRNA ligase [Aurantimicrobium sp. MWH-Uga1]AXE54560.1 Alanine--tRNA ligase [Aurantimicrobium sp. MWH-Uga1]
MQTAEIRQRWLDFFAARGHTVVPSASLVSDDPTLLFTVAGMVPFIPYLSGVVPPPYPRATSVQKCIRTLDIEEVGKTTRHGTFFQMNGNFSFGDYFKEQAIEYAWELLTTSEADGGLGFAERDLWVTVYEDDDEAIGFWKKTAGLPDERIQRRGKEDNYWSTGQPGPAGPCSEIYFDRGPAYGIEGGPVADEDRYIEIWNLVFMQYLRGEGTSKTEFEILGELPNKNIDTGMGLERVAFLKQGVENLYEIDQVRPVLDRAADLAGVTYGANQENDVRLRVVADHVRSALMLMADGVQASNEGRGYILRRLLRRSVRAMRLLGVDAATFPELFTASRDAMKAAYPDVESEYARISQIAYGEEETFLKTLASGTTILDTAVSETKKSGAKALAGDTAFLLHDTFGFPIDLTLEMAEEAGLSVDRAAFDKLMLDQRTRAKADAKAKKSILADLSIYTDLRAKGETVFTGYTDLETETSILGLLKDGLPVQSASAGDVVEVIVGATSLYAESGGQVSDAGSIIGDGFDLEVLDVQKPVKGLVSHTVEVRSGQVNAGAAATTVVDKNYRAAAAAAHSATHLVHAALREVLGETAHQAGSLNKAGYMRFDFSWNDALSSETKTEIEEIANKAILADYDVVTREMALEEAKKMGAMALFGEKYGETVRMVDIGGPWSRELCAGTHVSHSSQVGLINLISESSVGSSNRRVEALVGADAFKSLAAERAIVHELSSSLKAPRDQVITRVADLMTSLKAAERKIAEFEAAAVREQIPALVNAAAPAGNVTAIVESVSGVASVDDLRNLVTGVREKVQSTNTVIALGAVVEDKPVVIVATTEAARDKGAKAGALAKLAAGVLGGGGGGRDDLAQGGGANTGQLPTALDAVLAELRSL